MTLARRCAISFALLLAPTLFGAAPALGATHTWIGPANGAWSNPANWSGGKPSNGESGGTIVQFGANTTSSMDISGLVVDQIHFTGNNNTINGTTTLTISGSNLVQNIVSGGSGNTLGSTLPVATAGAALLATSSAGTLTIAGTISGTLGLVFLGSGGDFSLTGSNTYTGPTNIESGALHIATPTGYVIVGSALTVGTGSGPGAQLVLDNSSDISPQTPVTVNSDGLMNFQLHSDSAKSLTVDGGSVVGASLAMAGPLVLNDGTVTIAGIVTAGSLSMTGGTIGGAGALYLSGDIQATSSPSGPATVASRVQLQASPTVTVTPSASGFSPELRVTGVIGELGSSQTLTKAGAGALLTTADNTYTGTTTVNAGTLLVNGSQTGAFSVGGGGTLGGSGTLGATTVGGVLAPTVPGLHTGTLTFGPTGSLDVTVSSVAPGTIPPVVAAGAVAIGPGAALNLVVAPGTAIPHGSSITLIDDGSGAIGGQFTGLPDGSALTTPDGVPLVVNYEGGDGNDLVLTAGNVPPHAGSISVTPNPVAAGQQVALQVTESDANQDPLATTWNFGDGTTGSGTATSHTYATPGTYSVVATISDGTAQVQSTVTITVTGTSTGGGTRTPAGGGTRTPAGGGTGAPPGAGAGPAGTSTIKSNAYGADFVLTVPRACVRRGTAFGVALSISKQTKRKAKGRLLVKVAKVVFVVGGKALKTETRAPFRALLAVAAGAAPGRSVRLSATAYLKLRGGKRGAKAITAAVTVC